MPGKLNYGSAGNGTPGHLTGEMFKRGRRHRLQHVPYKGSAPAVTDLLGGQIPLMFDPLQSVLSQRAGRQAARARGPQQARSPVAARRADDRRIRLHGLRDHRVVGRVRAGRTAATR